MFGKTHLDKRVICIHIDPEEKKNRKSLVAKHFPLEQGLTMFQINKYVHFRDKTTQRQNIVNCKD